MSPPHFPIAPSGLLGSWSFNALEPGAALIGGFSVLGLEIPHKGGRTFGYRISDGNKTIAYLSDHCPASFGPGPAGLGEYHEAALSLASECDVLFHDAQYTDGELPVHAIFGHASTGYAVGLAEAAGARQLLFYHHDPARTDDEIDSIVKSYEGADLAGHRRRAGNDSGPCVNALLGCCGCRRRPASATRGRCAQLNGAARTIR